MPTSATGPRAEPGVRAAGFTLLEVMVVTAIVTILLALVQLKFRDRGETALALEARRFVAALHDCRQAAVLSATPTGILVAADGWQRLSYRGGWQMPAAGAREARHRLPLDVVLAASASPSADAPAVVCLPNGETAVGRVTLARRGHPGRYEFAENADGNFVHTWRAGAS